MKWLILLLIFILVLLSTLGILLLLLSKSKQRPLNCLTQGCSTGQTCSTLGTCIPQGTCLVDTDCPSNICVDGLCLSGPPIQTPCQVDGECYNAGERCLQGLCSASCQRSSDCLAGNICLNRVCQPKLCQSYKDCSPGQECAFVSDSLGKQNYYCIGGEKCQANCAQGLKCLDGFCQQCSASDRSYCGVEICFQGQCQKCSREHPCPSGSTCTPEGACCPSSSYAQVCTSDSQCPSENSNCLKGKCSCTLLSQGALCSQNSDCLDGSCREIKGVKKCSSSACLTNRDCPTDKPFCQGICTNQVLGSTCSPGQEQACLEAGYFCVQGTCSSTPGGYGALCQKDNQCSAGMNCRGGHCQPVAMV